MRSVVYLLGHILKYRQSHSQQFPLSHHPHHRPILLRLRLLYRLQQGRPIVASQGSHKVNIAWNSANGGVPGWRSHLWIFGYQSRSSQYGTYDQGEFLFNAQGLRQALSPLFTVLAYALLFQVSYSPATYLSLLPLTLGVMLACSFDLTISNVLGLICAFGSTLVFVSQTIFFKRIMPTESSTPHKLDKINLLYFSSGMAFILMIPVWIYSDAWRLLHHSVPSTGPSVIIYFIVNGTVHFAQNLLAFAILSSTSPVTYSIASLVKRIAVICLAIVWFKQSVHSVQAVGIGLTAVGLWMYNNAKRDVEKGEKKMRQIEAVRDGILPLNKIDQQILESAFSKDVHKSPRPIYPHNYLHSSKSSAIRSGPARPYPSPPASASSSPTSDPIPPKHTRHGRASSGTRECHPQPITSLTTTIDDISRPTIMAS